MDCRTERVYLYREYLPSISCFDVIKIIRISFDVSSAVVPPTCDLQSLTIAACSSLEHQSKLPYVLFFVFSLLSVTQRLTKGGAPHSIAIVCDSDPLIVAIDRNLDRDARRIGLYGVVDNVLNCLAVVIAH